MKPATQSKSHRPTVFPLSRLATALAFALPALSAQLSYAQPVGVSAAPGSSQPGISAAGGVPLVNIVAPNGAGISHNNFTNYNVGHEGLILNNSTTSANTVLGGQISANPQLGKTPASIILNEVTGPNASVLSGRTEIAGHAARLIVANPNGITVSGGGFINTNRVTLTTGKAVLDTAGNLSHIDTTTGHLQIDGDGLDAHNIDQVDLIARSLSVNAALQTKKLDIAAGLGHTYFNEAVLGVIGESSATGPIPTVAIDVSRLGSIHADSINLIGSERGVGVNIGGNVEALTGHLSITSSGAVTVASGATLSAAQKLSVVADLNNSGTVAAHDIDVVGVLTNTGGKLSSSGKLSAVGDLHNSGMIDSHDLSETGNLTNTGGTVIADGKLSVIGGIFNIDGGEIQADRPVIIGPTVGKIDRLRRKSASLPAGSTTTSTAIPANPAAAASTTPSSVASNAASASTNFALDNNAGPNLDGNNLFGLNSGDGNTIGAFTINVDGKTFTNVPKTAPAPNTVAAVATPVATPAAAPLGKQTVAPVPAPVVQRGPATVHQPVAGQDKANTVMAAPAPQQNDRASVTANIPAATASTTPSPSSSNTAPATSLNLAGNNLIGQNNGKGNTIGLFTINVDGKTFTNVPKTDPATSKVAVVATPGSAGYKAVTQVGQNSTAGHPVADTTRNDATHIVSQPDDVGRHSGYRVATVIGVKQDGQHADSVSAGARSTIAQAQTTREQAQAMREQAQATRAQERERAQVARQQALAKRVQERMQEREQAQAARQQALAKRVQERMQEREQAQAARQQALAKRVQERMQEREQAQAARQQALAARTRV